MYNKINKISLILIVFVLSCISVFSSEYRAVYHEEFNDDFKTGEVSLGRLILTKEIFNEDTFNFSINNTISTIKTGDYICNREVTPLNVVGHLILLQNQCYNGFIHGAYTLEYLNLNLSYVLNVDYPPNPNINFDTSYSIFDMYFSKDNFTLGNDTEVFINLSLPTYLLPSSYELIFSESNHSFRKEIKVIKNIAWNILSNNVTNRTIHIGKVGDFSEIVIENTGNTHTRLEVSIEGTGAKFLSCTDEFMSYPKNNISFDILYDANEEFEPKNYTANIIVTDDIGQTKRLNYTFIVKDEILPIINNSKFVGKLESTRDFVYIFNATDNSKIDYCILDVIYNGKNVFNEKILREDIFSDEYNYTLNFETLGEYQFNVDCLDIHGNKVHREESASIVQLDAFRYVNTIRFPKNKIETWLNQSFIKSDVSTTIKITLTNLEYEGNDFSIRITNKDDKYLINNINETLEINDFWGNTTIEFQGDIIGSFEGNLFLEGIITHKNLNSIFFSGELIDYEIPEPFSDDWLGGIIDCHYENVNDWEASKTICMIEKSGLIGKDKIGVPMTLNEKDELYKSHADTIQLYKNKVFTRTFFIIIFIIGILFLLFVIFYIRKIEPIMRWRPSF